MYYINNIPYIDIEKILNKKYNKYEINKKENKLWKV